MIENYEFLLIRNLADARDKGKISGICKVNLAYILIDLREKFDCDDSTQWIYVVKFSFTNPINNETEYIHVNISPQEVYQSFDTNEWLLYLYSNIYQCGEEQFICNKWIQVLTEQNVKDLVQKSISKFMGEYTNTNNPNPTKYGFKKEIKKEDN